MDMPKILICILLFAGTGASQTPEDRLRQDIADGRLDDCSRIEAAFVLSGATQPDSLLACLNWYGSLLQTIREFRFNPFDRIGSAAKAFAYLHSSWLLHYQTEATTLLDVTRQQRFNCVSATVLFNLLCEDFGWTTEAFETPTHVYTVFVNFTERVPVENTSPMGFDIMRNLAAYSRFLAQFYPQNRALQIGLDRLYAYENSRGRTIDNTELLGLLAYNRAFLAGKKGDFASAYRHVLSAQQFNADSRSNRDFEIGLLYRWGDGLVKASRHTEAFEVYARGVRRHPDDGGLKANARTAALNALAETWNAKNWSSATAVVQAASGLGALGANDFETVRMFLGYWAAYWSGLGRSREAAEVAGLRKAFSQE